MQKKKIKEYILGGIALFIALFTLIGMSINLTQIENYKEYEAISKYDFHECGFSMLKFKSDLIGGDYSWGNALLGVFNLFHLLACLIAIGLVIASFIALNNRKKLFNFIAIVIGVVFSVLYMVEGIVFTSLCSDGYSEEFQFQTVAFVPLIIVAISAVAYFIVDKMYVVDGVESVRTVKEEQPSVQAAEPAEKKVDVEQIKQLKELLDMGAITQEEYDAKKKEILNG